MKRALFKFKPFSVKQKKILTWWLEESGVSEKDGIIADGAIRSGKTVSMSLSFVMWAMESFSSQNFAMCGKTISSFRRNVWFWLKIMLFSRGYRILEHRNENMVEIHRAGKVNYFYIFGGKDESSQDLIQGITLAGVFFDEVALMPKSFVDQATGRCSVEGSKFFFNCNPKGPYHWFKLEWVDRAKEKNILYLHFTMDDNLSLSEKIKERYRSMYTGVFFRRFILGLWVLAEGLIYDMFDEEKHKVKTQERPYSKYYVSMDYGTQNPTTFNLWGEYQGKWFKVKEYYYSGRSSGIQKTDEEYANEYERWIGSVKPAAIIVDPSAASFIATMRKRGYKIIPARNEVLDGIRVVSSLLYQEILLYNDCCKETFKEFSSYSWDPKAAERGEDKPIKESDHCLDGDRYFVYTILRNLVNKKERINHSGKGAR